MLEPREPRPNDEVPGLLAPDGPERDAPGARFAWHPEPELVDYHDPAISRASLERLGRDAWTVALDYLYGHAFARARGKPAGWEALRHIVFADDPADAAALGLATPHVTADLGDRLSGRMPSLEAPDGPRPAPRRGRPSAELLGEFALRVAPYQLSSYHPRALSYFTPPPLVLSIVGELLAQVGNQGVDIWQVGPAATLIEEETLRWLCELVGFWPRGFGILTSGGVMANFMALAVARDVHLARLRADGAAPRGRTLEGVRVYASDQAHFSIGRALDLLGFPPETLHVVDSDAVFRLHGAPVAQAVAADRAAGMLPLAIAAVAGSTNTGSVDLVGELADVAAKEDLWLHVDAAYGAAARLSQRDAIRVPDLERADSVTADPHKWFFQAYDIGALLVRRREHLSATFYRSPEYLRVGGRLAPEEASRPGAPLDFYQWGMEGTRRFRALKLWMSWQHLGTEGLGRLVEANNDLAAYLARRCAESDDFEVLPAEPPLSVVCFRHMPGGRLVASQRDQASLDDHQAALQRALEASGDGWLSTTRLRGVRYLRAGIMNYLSTEADIDRLLDTLRALASDLP